MTRFFDRASSVLFPQVDKITQVYFCRVKSLCECTRSYIQEHLRSNTKSIENGMYHKKIGTSNRSRSIPEMHSAGDMPKFKKKRFTLRVCECLKNGDVAKNKEQSKDDISTLNKVKQSLLTLKRKHFKRPQRTARRERKSLITLYHRGKRRLCSSIKRNKLVHCRCLKDSRIHEDNSTKIKTDVSDKKRNFIETQLKQSPKTQMKFELKAKTLQSDQICIEGPCTKPNECKYLKSRKSDKAENKEHSKSDTPQQKKLLQQKEAVASCVCHKDENKVNDTHSSNEKRETRKRKDRNDLKIKKRKRPKLPIYNYDKAEYKKDNKETENFAKKENINNLTFDICSGGVCANKASNKKNKHYICNCKDRREKLECRELSCERKIPADTLNNYSRMKHAFSYLCYKLNIKGSRTAHYKSNICKKGVCEQAYKYNINKFICKCETKPDIVECTDISCNISAGQLSKEVPFKSRTQQTPVMKKKNKDIYTGHGDQINSKLLRIQTHDNNTKKKKQIETKKPKMKKNVKNKDLTKNKLDRIQMANQDAGDQTGEPFFEMIIDEKDMCVLNSKQISKNMKEMGKLGRTNLSCICPSHTEHMRAFANYKCSGGICQKAFQDKQTNFNCKCQKNRQCSDGTCDIKLKKENEKFFRLKCNKRKPTPLKKEAVLEVMLGAKSMRIQNAEEIRNKMVTPKEGACKAGICKIWDRKKENFDCKCLKTKLKTERKECDDGSCASKKTCHIGSIKSKICDLSSRLVCKSENWTCCKNKTNRRQRRSRRHSLAYANPGGISGSKSEPRHKKTRDGTMFKPIKRHSRKHVRSSIIICKKSINSKSRKKKSNLTKSGICKKRQKKDLCTNKKSEKAHKKILAAIKAEDTTGTNCLLDCTVGVMSLLLMTVKQCLYITYRCIFYPQKSYQFVKRAFDDPDTTLCKIRNWVSKAWSIRKLRMNKTMEGSHTMSVLSDTIQELKVYQAFVEKGVPTKVIEKKARLRKKRIRKRENEALYGCRHMLLTTLRNTPCLWVYHICPNLYPQFLSTLEFLKSFLRILIFGLAVLFWTPCILSVEFCRAICCCLLCTN